MTEDKNIEFIEDEDKDLENIIEEVYEEIDQEIENMMNEPLTEEEQKQIDDFEKAKTYEEKIEYLKKYNSKDGYRYE